MLVLLNHLPVNCHIIAVPGSSSKQGAGGVNLDAVDPALLVWRHAVLRRLQARDLVHVPRVHVHHHQLVALRTKDHLLV